MNFDEAERKFTDLKNQRDSGQISPAEFSSRVDEIRLQDIGGVWWQISEKDGQWLRWNGSAWVQGEPVRITASSMPIRYPVNTSESPPSTPQVPPVSTVPVYTTTYHYPAEDRDNKRKYILSGLLGIILILTALVYFNVGGIQDILGPGGPENTVFKYYQAVDSGDYNSGLDLLVTESLQPLDEDYRTRITQHNAVTLGYGIHGEGIEFKNLTVTNKQKITDKKYIIDVTGTVGITSPTSGLEQTMTHYATFIVVDINGNWKLVFPHQIWNVEPNSNTYQDSISDIPESSIPVLLSPSNGVLMDNGCKASNDRIIWDFQWSKVPKATQYQIYVIGKTAQNPVVNTVTVNNWYHFENTVGSEVQGPNMYGWSWKVRAQVDGIWNEYSTQNYFDVKPMCT